MREVVFLGDRGCRPAALDAAEDLLELAQRNFGSHSLETAEALDLLAEGHFWLGERSEIPIARAREALAIRRAHAGSHPAALARSHRNLGALLASQLGERAHMREAWQHYGQARLLWQSSVGEESSEIADLLTWFAELLDDWGAEGRLFATREPWISELLDEKTRSGRTVVDTLRRFTETLSGGEGAVLSIASDPALAMALRSVAVARAVGVDTEAHAEALNVLGNLFGRRQLFDSALQAYEQCLRIRLRIFAPGHPQLARAYHNRGEALMLVGELEAAWPDLERGYRMRLAASSNRYPASVATSLQLMGKWLFYTGDLQSAVGLYVDALPRLEQIYGPAHWRYAEGVTNLAEVYEELGEVDLAKGQYRRALSILASGSPAGARAARVKARLGALMARTGDQKLGEELLLESLRMMESLPEIPLPYYAETLRGLARVASMDRDPQRALALNRAAVEALDRYAGEHPDLIDVLLTVSEIEQQLQLDGASGKTLDRVEGLLPKFGEAAYHARARAHLLRARLAMRSSDDLGALMDATRAAELYARHLAPAAAVLPEDSGLRLALENRESLDLTLSLLAETNATPELIRRAWEAVAMHRGLVASELKKRQVWANRAEEPGLPALLEELNRARKLLAETQVRAGRSSTFQEGKAALGYADAKLRAAERAVAEKLARRPSDGVILDARVSDFLGAMPSGSALVAFSRYHDPRKGATSARYGVFVATSGSRDPHFVDLGAAANVDRLVGEWRASLLKFGESWRETESRLEERGLALKAVVWETLSRLTDPAKRVFIVPDGALFLVPWTALPGEAASTYLLEDGYEFHYVVNERDLAKHWQRGAGPERVLAVGGAQFDGEATGPPEGRSATAPAFSLMERWRELKSSLERFLRDPCRGGNEPYFLPLAEAAQEVHDVATVLRESAIKTGQQVEVTTLSAELATETAFKELAPGHSVVHVATHAFFDLECRQESADRVEQILLDDKRLRPFVSGLAFAGANRRHKQAEEDDGILTLPEILGLDLSQVVWVVLAACETGIGQVALGEGALGLARSFQIAGAHTLILSLWPVEDRATREWMNELYRARFLERETTARSLRSASLSMLQNRRSRGEPTHPFFWAAFVAVGNWN